MPKKITAVTSQQKLAIELLLEGYLYKDIAKKVRCNVQSLRTWMRQDYFCEYLYKREQEKYKETCLFHFKYASEGFEKIRELATNGENQRIQLDAAKYLVQMTLSNIKTLDTLKNKEDLMALQEQVKELTQLIQELSEKAESDSNKEGS